MEHGSSQTRAVQAFRACNDPHLRDHKGDRDPEGGRCVPPADPEQVSEDLEGNLGLKHTMSRGTIHSFTHSFCQQHLLCARHAVDVGDTAANETIPSSRLLPAHRLMGRRAIINLTLTPHFYKAVVLHWGAGEHLAMCGCSFCCHGGRGAILLVSSR